eukprot:scaffold13627_cov109-Isochrysis_galbana.AAC.6
MKLTIAWGAPSAGLAKRMRRFYGCLLSRPPSPSPSHHAKTWMGRLSPQLHPTTPTSSPSAVAPCRRFHDEPPSAAVGEAITVDSNACPFPVASAKERCGASWCSGDKRRRGRGASGDNGWPFRTAAGIGSRCAA